MQKDDSQQQTNEPMATWEDERTQIVYRLLCDGKEPPNLEEHWEGWVARRIVAALIPAAAEGESNMIDDKSTKADVFAETLMGAPMLRQKAGRVQQGWRRGNGKWVWFDIQQVGEDASDVEE
jgi:hypothetical protein